MSNKQISSSPQQSTKTKGLVLLVDDEKALLRTYSRVLRQAGFSVEEASDGQMALRALVQHDFDVVVSDISMPEMDGIAMLAAVRQRDPDLPVILMTAGADVTMVMRAIEHGALHYLLKPVEHSRLCEVVEEAVGLRQVAKLKSLAFELYGVAAKSASHRSDLTVHFDRALATLYMEYQPIVRWSARSVIAYEALLRTREMTLRRPDDLLAAAETLNRVHEVGRAVRDCVARTAEVATSDKCIFVNLHPRDLEDEQLYSAAAPLTRLATRIILEITERASLDEVGDIQGRLSSLRAFGYRLALDDLGAGYAGLTSLAKIKPEVVKLDMSLVRGVEKDPTKQKLVRSLTAVCKELEMQVIAEGVETSSERDRLVDLGCDHFQGYLFARPGIPFPEVKFDSRLFISLDPHHSQSGASPLQLLAKGAN
jgi:EAL domain-containing protein (putative c-di-GMP-specific phosphodiesterase class I)